MRPIHFVREEFAMNLFDSVSLKRFGLSLSLLAIMSSPAAAAANDEPGLPPPSASSSANEIAPNEITPNEITSAALSRARQKLAHAQEVAGQFATRASAEGLPEGWRAQLIIALLQSAESDFGAVENAASTRAALVVAHDSAIAHSRDRAVAARPKSLGDVSDDLTFIPLISPCRIVDTRAPGAGGALAAGETRVFIFDNALSQGGSSTCSPFGGYVDEGQPGAAAINITVDATGSTAVPGSFLRAFPDGGSASTSWLNFSGGQVIANEGILGISSEFRFDIRVNGRTNVIVDVYGSFVRPQATALSCINTALTTTTVQPGGSVVVLQASCPADYTPIVPYCYTTSTSVLQQGSGVGGPTIGSPTFCAWTNFGGVAATVYGATTCCQIPGRAKFGPIH